MSERVPAPLRRRVRKRAAGRCEYCLIHEDDVGLPLEPDHILAAKHGGGANEANLAWACFVCNRRKGADLASIYPLTGMIVRLFNPRADERSRHFRLENGNILPLTAEARATENLLQLNRPENVEIRRLLVRAGWSPSSTRK